jgi:hypothetical protein
MSLVVKSSAVIAVHALQSNRHHYLERILRHCQGSQIYWAAEIVVSPLDHDAHLCICSDSIDCF